MHRFECGCSQHFFYVYKTEKKQFDLEWQQQKETYLIPFFFVLFQLQCNNTQHCRLQSGSSCFEEIVQDLRSEQAARNDAAAAILTNESSRKDTLLPTRTLLTFTYQQN